MDPIPELNLPGLSPTAARAFTSTRFSSDDGPIPDGTPHELYMYHPRDFRDEYRELVFQKRVFHYFAGKCFVECIPCMIWLLNGWSSEFGTFCLNRVNTFISTLGPGHFKDVIFQAPQDVAKCISFLWDFVILHSWTPVPYNWMGPAIPTIIKLSKCKTGTDTSADVDPKAPGPNYKFSTLWCKIQVRHLVRRLDASYAPCAPTFYKRRGYSMQPHEYDDRPLHPVPPPDKFRGLWTEREELYALKDMREAAKKISAREFVHSDVQALLKKTDLSSLVERYFCLLDKGEFKFLDRVKVQGNTFGGFV
ncbi:hypothetical protein C7212DRAFT_361999 [Tuber magnatum]|uniref:Uncharacterized protein n=1 Tax=Tuber magnatum TaxID=42249 RepID=A0A317SYP0_9PEZI|nr:hypothetical protein C7212DRAFT_361999 [Tuber magnatum]